MPAESSLKRLGGGRWETRDGRFVIEPQSGTWAVVDGDQTDELGLPLVRGPFASLTAAKEAIERARETTAVESPLAERIRAARPREAHGAATRSRAVTSQQRDVTAAPSSASPQPPPEPAWLRDLAPAKRRKARDLIERLDELGIDGGAEIARAEIAREEPALARLALRRRLRAAIAAAKNPDEAIRSALDLLSNGRDRELDVRWRLVDEMGRPLGDLKLDD